MRLLAGTATLIAAPPPAGASESAETETSKAMTLSAGASPKRTCVDVVPGAGVGVGPGAMEALPPPPQPVTNAMVANTKHANNNLFTGAKECLKMYFCILSYLQEGTKFFEVSVLSPP